MLCLFLAGLATFATLHATQPLLPELMIAFDITASQSTWSLSAATLGIGIALLIVGPLTDMVGRTRLMIGSLFASALVGIAIALTTNWHLLVVLRAVQGVTVAGVPATATAYLREEVHHSARLQVTGRYIGGTAIGGMSGRLLSGLVTDLAGWREALIALAILGLICAVLVHLYLPRSQNFQPAPRQLKAVATQFGRGLSDPVLLALYGIGGTLFGAFVAIYNGMAFRLVSEPYLLSVGAVSLVFLCYALGTFSSGFASRQAARFSTGPVVLISIAATLGGVLITLAEPLVLVVFGLAVVTAAFFGAHGVASAWVPARAVDVGAGAGQAASLYLCVYYIGSSIFGAAAGATWTAAHWPGVALMAAALLVVAAILAAFSSRLSRR